MRSKRKYLPNMTRMAFAAVAVLVCCYAPLSNAKAECQLTNDVLEGMSKAQLEIRQKGKIKYTMKVRVADDWQESAAGFQHVCGETVDEWPILFLYRREFIPQFHMRNVKVPLDIAFVDRDGLIVSIQLMQPYVIGSTRKPKYSPNKPIVTALETRAGFFSENRISVGDIMRWLPDVDNVVEIDEKNTINEATSKGATDSHE